MRSVCSYCIRKWRILQIKDVSENLKTVRLVSTRQRETTGDIYGNPLNKLQPFLQIPLLPGNQKIFDPSRKEIANGSKLFLNDPKRKHEITFVKSAVRTEQLPDIGIPEVAFLGRSNVGKSSLIHALFHQSPDVHVKISSKPGQTRTLNFFQVGKAFTLVDMPGYGFNMPDHFDVSVEEYLRTRRRLCRTFMLVDGVVGLTKSDRTGIQMLEELSVPYVLVMTKIDKTGRHRLLENLLQLLDIRDKSGGHCCFPQPFLLSSKTGEGIPLLQTFIAYITGCVQVKGV